MAEALRFFSAHSAGAVYTRLLVHSLANIKGKWSFYERAVFEDNIGIVYSASAEDVS